MTHIAAAQTTEPRDTIQAGPAAPENIARLLGILRVLLEFGRHFLATLENRSHRPGFGLFHALFGTPELSVMLAQLHRGVLRAAALESLLLGRAATGQDIAAPAAANPNQAPNNEAFHIQIARLTAQRARHDTQADPNHLATPEDIEAEIRARPIGQTIDAIRRDLGIIAIASAENFWHALTTAIAGYQDTAALPEMPQSQPAPSQSPEWPSHGAAPAPEKESPLRSWLKGAKRRVNASALRQSFARLVSPARQPEPESRQPENQPQPRHEIPVKQQTRLPKNPSPRPAPGFKSEPAAQSRPVPAQARRRANIPLKHQRTTPPATTGPPPRAAPKRAA